MAITEKVVVDMNDDLTGDSIPQGGGRTVRFGFGTPEQFTTYDLELSTANEKELEDFLSRYKAAGRIVKPDTAKTAGRTNSTADSEIRKWARSRAWMCPHAERSAMKFEPPTRHATRPRTPRPASSPQG